MAVLGLCCCTGFTLAAVLGLLTAVASLPNGTQALGCGFRSCGTWAQ